MPQSQIQDQIAEIISRSLGEPVTITGMKPIGGGCINDAQQVETDKGRFFMKYNSASHYPGMFEAEARGLQLLEDAGCLKVPAVIGHGETNNQSILVLEYIAPAAQKSGFWQEFGEGLARMHQQQPDDGRFGLDHDNYIGSLPQGNRTHDDWISFFISERLEAQLKLARDNGRAGKELSTLFEKFYRYVTDFFPEEPPALLHGDLWGGNYMTGEEGEPVIIDPAVYYGHRYMDLGMSKLFGGFSAAFYDAYNEHYPLDKGWQEGTEIANLYPLMVHVNLFGGGYPGQVKNILRRFA